MPKQPTRTIADMQNEMRGDIENLVDYVRQQAHTFANEPKRGNLGELVHLREQLIAILIPYEVNADEEEKYAYRRIEDRLYEDRS